MDRQGLGYLVLAPYNKDITPVCTTELGSMAGLQPEFAKQNTSEPASAIAAKPGSGHIFFSL
jgi:peroxiredoxin